MELQPYTEAMRTRQMSKDINLLKRRGRGRSTGGDATLRDSIFGVPANMGDRVQLAGQRWYDTTYGLMFQYYADDLDPVAPGLKAQSGGWFPADVRQPYVLADKNIAQTIATTTPTAITWRSGTDIYDPFGMYDPANNTRFTVPWSGIWRVDAKFRITGSVAATGEIRRNGAAYARSRVSDVGAAGASTSLMFNSPIYVGAGQYLEMFITMATSTSVTVFTNAETYMAVRYEGPAYS